MLFVLLTLALAGGVGPTSAQPRYRLETKPTKQISAVLAVRMSYSSLLADRWTLIAAQAPATPGQSKVASRLTPGGYASQESSPLRRTALTTVVPATNPALKQGVAVQVSHQALLHSRRLVELKPNESTPKAKALGAQERHAALLASDILDHASPKFQSWLKETGLRRGADEADLDFARRAYTHIQKNFSYDYKTTMNRRSSFISGAGSSDCGGLCGVFASVLRANGIPARLLVGRWATSDKDGEAVNGIAYHQCHVKAEFFAKDIGWIPVDMSGGVAAAKAADPLRHFGFDAGDFLVLHIDPILMVDTGAGVKEVTWLQGVAHWVAGAGKADNGDFEERWTVEAKDKK